MHRWNMFQMDIIFFFVLVHLFSVCCVYLHSWASVSEQPWRLRSPERVRQQRAHCYGGVNTALRYQFVCGCNELGKPNSCN